SETQREAIGLFDEMVPRPTPAEELTIARAAVEAGVNSRAVRGFARSLGQGPGTPRDRFDYGFALLKLGRATEAIAQFNRVTGPPALVAAARYLRGRALFARGDLSGARKALNAVATAFPKDTSGAAALYFLGDVAIDDGRDAEARSAFDAVATRFPSTRFA